MDIKLSDGGYNRFEVLDKRDVLTKLTRNQNQYLHTDIDLYKRISRAIIITSRSTAKLFVFDNKSYRAMALNHQTYDLLYYLLNQCTRMHLDPNPIRKSHDHLVD